MRKKINVSVVNPAGNITIFVLDKFDRSQYQNIAHQLLENPLFKGEQVAFITGKNSMEMCGLEFCGNAARSFALMSAINMGLQGEAIVTVDVSGSKEPLNVEVDTLTNYTKIKMPSPSSVLTLENCPIKEINGCTLVDFDGIIHLIVRNMEGTRKNFDVIKEYINKKYNPPAIGVMFYNTENNFLTPVVYVKEVDTTYFEGSCGSGTTALAVALSYNKEDGTYSYTLPQPAGTLTSTVVISQGRLDSVYIEGPVEIGQLQEIEIDL